MCRSISIWSKHFTLMYQIQVKHHDNYGSKEKTSSKESFKKEIVT